MVLPDGRRNQPGHFTRPGRRGHVDRLRLAWCDASARSRREEPGHEGFSTIGTVGLLLMAAPLLGYLIGAGILQSAAFFTRSPCTRRSVSSSFSWARWRCAGYGLDGVALRRYAGRHFGPHAAARCRGRPGTARLAVHFGKASRALRAGLPGWAHHAGHHRAAGKRLAVECARLDRLHRARLAAAEALRQSEERYRSLVEAQPDPICQFRPDTTLTFVNRAYAQFYGTEPEELIGRRWLDFAPRDERPRLLDELSSFTPEHPERQEETRSTRGGPGGALVPVSPLRFLR